MSEPIWDKDLGLWVYNDMPLTELESRAFDGGRSSIIDGPNTTTCKVTFFVSTAHKDLWEMGRDQAKKEIRER